MSDAVSDEANKLSEKSCSACLQKIHIDASLCNNCGTRQNVVARRFFLSVAVLGGLATVLSLISAGIALAPQAYSTVFPSPRPSVFEMRFDTRDLNTRTKGVFDLYNAGNRDVFATKLIFKPQGDMFSSLGNIDISIYEMIPSNTAIKREIRLISSARPTRPSELLLNEDNFQKLFTAMKDQNSLDVMCFRLLPMNASKKLSEPENGRLRNDIASTTLMPSLEFLTVKDDEILATVPVKDFYVEAAVYFRRSCLSKVGGREGFFAITAN
ncbi:MAG: hypothetical protein ACI84R_001384 [Candidatus Azotimanducaceae bacterium]|jgi:hypothetical protein